MKTPTSLAVFILVSSLFIHWESRSQTEKKHYETPKLVVGVMMDQLRPDYIYRYWDKFGEDGFKRLLNEGFTFTNNHFDYMPTATGPGHASVYTGATPAVHGVMGNSWYVRDLDKSINVIEVPGLEGVGSEPGQEGDKGPGNVLTTTVGDELRLHTNFRSKVVGISRKDRGAILPAGHTGDAYWFEGGTGNFVTSTYYYDELPAWVKEFNDRKLVEQYLAQPWETLLPIEEYIESIPDDNPYERMFDGETAPVFPHNLPALMEKSGPGVISSTPFGNDLLLDLAIAAIEGESLGSRETSDILAISFSATDAVGHQFGPASIEAQDTYLRLDQTMARLLDYLDENFGKENILLFLTSDHGVAHVPDYLVDQGIPGGHFDSNKHIEALRSFLQEKYGENLLLSFSNFEVFLDHQLIDQNNLDHEEVQNTVARFMLSLDGVAGALTATALNSGEFTQGIRARVQQGYNQKRSGDVLIWLEPHITPGTGSQGTTHGSPWVYDAHAPMHWYGWDVPAGTSSHPVSISDIASTVATFLNSPFPSGNIGKPMNEHMRK
jgi:predicted AlkP superfamily pyrophosphatase or phosphodiesterase